MDEHTEFAGGGSATAATYATMSFQELVQVREQKLPGWLRDAGAVSAVRDEITGFVDALIAKAENTD